ncbi:hypothetical protein [Actinokineospora sp. HUAS TT18]|uniref:hypothetical protein n=1 Tax=Actinokineospora sp. HUAS TT18 TaxID=3447451 RepID=UPI003F526B51
MTFAIGIFDLLTYAIPGSLYLTFFGYLAARLHLLGFAPNTVPAWLLVVGVILLSYLLGYLAYPIGAKLDRVIPRRHRQSEVAEFLHRVPAAKGRAFVDTDPHLLQAALELQDREVALEVSRLRAAGLMLRNSAPPLVWGFAAAVVEIFIAPNRWLAVGCAVLLVSWPVLLIIQGRRLRRWAHLKTLELCFWVPDIDERSAGSTAETTKPAAG